MVWVPAFTDFKLYDITAGPQDPNREPCDMTQPVGSPELFRGNDKFLTRRLWGIAANTVGGLLLRPRPGELQGPRLLILGPSTDLPQPQGIHMSG